MNNRVIRSINEQLKRENLSKSTINEEICFRFNGMKFVGIRRLFLLKNTDYDPFSIILH